MTLKQQVIDLHRNHPDWPAQRLAKELGCKVEQIFVCKHRYALKIPRAQQRAANPNSVFALGREARRAGLTVEKIQEIGRGAR